MMPFFFLILQALTRVAASNMVVTKKRPQGSTINNDLCENFYDVKTMRLLECRMH